MAEPGGFLTREPIDAWAGPDDGVLPGHGGVVSFRGVVRDIHAGRRVTGIEYVAYDVMAEREAAAIVGEAEARWPVRVHLRHQLGALIVGDVAVVVLVTGAHRVEAFEACRWVIEAVKRRVPIWKHEQYADGSTAWVDPTARDATS